MTDFQCINSARSGKMTSLWSFPRGHDLREGRVRGASTPSGSGNSRKTGFCGPAAGRDVASIGGQEVEHSMV